MAEDAIARQQIVGLGQRVQRCEEDVEKIQRTDEDCKAHQGQIHDRLWKKLGALEVELKVDLARQSTKVALLVGLISAVGSALASYLMQYIKGG